MDEVRTLTFIVVTFIHFRRSSSSLSLQEVKVKGDQEKRTINATLNKIKDFSGFKQLIPQRQLVFCIQNRVY